ncbi:alkaline phosphatase D family protein [Paraglaciecola arctica]|uniref:alkaline phosphatase D family protein n=1 Tax=Paraglaciecola arctica TaxID=1128911 RepID=UPI001C07781D|nr:alkaline phosphatase D family protein [Paraglaciecola arctica]MBU3005407.1 twin-arginine translocation signal domain-containing protein [Paraglaciecola arctica]
MQRRDFLKASAAIAASSTLSSCESLNKQSANVTLSNIAVLPQNQTSHWLGHGFWGNRLQDWRLHQGRLQCLRGEKSFEVRTVSLLTRALSNSSTAAKLRMTVGNITPDQSGFCGFLLGAGNQLDYRGAALVQRFAGMHGGVMARLHSDGTLSFNDFSDQSTPLGFTPLANQTTGSIGEVAARTITLECRLLPQHNGDFTLQLDAFDAKTQQLLGQASCTDVDAYILQGGISLLSSPDVKQAGARWWFTDIQTGGDKIQQHDNRGLGEVMGCMYSLNQNVLKLTSQFMPIDLNLHQQAQLEYRYKGESNWHTGPIATIEDGYVALFRISNWDHGRAAQYRIRFTNDEKDLFTGEIVKDHGSAQELKIALYSCIIPTAKSLDRDFYTKLHPKERLLGRYTTDNVLFPHNNLVNNCDSHQPDLYVFAGDQYYETYPTRYGNNTKDAKLDTLYRWYLWYWTFRDSIRNRPSIVLADDHDVLQGNLWGNSGKDPDTAKEENGGYVWDKSLIRMIYNIQHGHNPDAYDPTPIAHNIPVTYGSFIYGGVNFALVEDRKFKSPPNYKVDLLKTTGELLGKRQEQFLSEWKNTAPNLPKICLTASIWGSPQTKGINTPLLDFDSNGYPADGRNRAVQLVADAKALMLAGDQHLGLVAHQGINSFDDGALFFAGPAAAAFWQRWFESDGSLANSLPNSPNTGDYIDTFGNKMRVMAVANPTISYADFAAGNQTWGMFLADNKLKTEGYGLVRVNHQQQHFELECWHWNAKPGRDEQFAGWPIVHAFPRHTI